MSDTHEQLNLSTVIVALRHLTDETLPDTVSALVDADELDDAAAATAWRDLKLLMRDLGRHADAIRHRLLAETDPTHRGWRFDEGLSVIQGRAFDVEILDHAAFETWLAEQPGHHVKRAEVTWEAELNKAGQRAVKQAVTRDGEVVPGVRAEWGDRYLYVPYPKGR